MEEKQFGLLLEKLNGIDASLKKLSDCVEKDGWGRSQFRIKTDKEK